MRTVPVAGSARGAVPAFDEPVSPRFRSTQPGLLDCQSQVGTPVFTGDSCPAEAPPQLPRCAPSPCARRSHARTPTGTPPRPATNSRRRACPPPEGGRAATGRFPRSPPAGRRVRRPALPRQPRQGTPQPFPLASSPATTNRLRSRSPPLLRGGRALLTGPDPPGSGPARHLRKRHRWFLASTCSSCLPDPDRLAVPARPVVVRVRAAPTLPRVSTVRLPSASPACCDRPAAGPFHPARSW